MLLTYLGTPSATVTYSIDNADKTEHTAATGTGVTALHVGTTSALYGVVVADNLGGKVVNWYESAAYMASETIPATDYATAAICTEARLAELDAANLPADVDTLKARVVGTIAAGTHSPQSGDAYAVVNHITHGNSAINTAMAKDSTVMKAASYTAPDNTSIAAILTDTGTTIPAAITTLDGKVDTVDTVVDAVKAKTDNLPISPAAVGSAMTLTSAYDAAKTAASQAQAQTAAAAALSAYDPPTRAESTSDKAEVLDAVAFNGRGSGSDNCTLTITDSNGNIVPNCEVLVTTDGTGRNTAGFGVTDDSGHVPLRLDAGTIYYCWRTKIGIAFTNPVAFTAVADV